MNTNGPFTPIKYTKEQLEGISDNWANAYGVNPKLMRAIVEQESGWNPNAVSPTGVVGLAQMTLNTGKDTVKDSIAPELYANGIDRNNPYQQLDLMAAHLKKLEKQNKGNELDMAYAYNGGQGAVNAFKAGEAPYREETAKYGPAVMARMGKQVDVPATTIASTNPAEIVAKTVDPITVAKVDDTALKIAEANRDRSVAELEKSRLNRPEVEKDKGDGLARFTMNVPTLAANINYRPTKLGKKLNFDLQG